MNRAPIALFTFSRPDHTRRTVEALLQNSLVSSHDLIIFSDAARSQDQQFAVDQVRSYLKTITGFRSITTHYRLRNFGLARSIIEGVTQVLSSHERIIVMEDDLVTSPHFLTYMNDALDRFADDDRVISVHGYVYPVNRPLPEAFFLRGADCWGWATWRRGWHLFNADGQALLDQLLINKELLRTFDFDGAFGYSSMLKDQVKGLNDSWAVRWYASAFLADKLTLYPGRSLVHNIGSDGSGTHHGVGMVHDVALSGSPIDLSEVIVVPSGVGRVAVEAFFRTSSKSIFKTLYSRIKKYISTLSI